MEQRTEAPEQLYEQQDLTTVPTSRSFFYRLPLPMRRAILALIIIGVIIANGFGYTASGWLRPFVPHGLARYLPMVVETIDWHSTPGQPQAEGRTKFDFFSDQQLPTVLNGEPVFWYLIEYDEWGNISSISRHANPNQIGIIYPRMDRPGWRRLVLEGRVNGVPIFHGEVVIDVPAPR